MRLRKRYKSQFRFALPIAPSLQAKPTKQGLVTRSKQPQYLLLLSTLLLTFWLLQALSVIVGFGVIYYRVDDKIWIQGHFVASISFSEIVVSVLVVIAKRSFCQALH